MKRFTQLYNELDESNRTSEKLAALVRYFDSATPADAAWGLYVLSGRRTKRAIKSSVLWRCAVEASGLPEWLLSECHAAVGDFSETLALVLPTAKPVSDVSIESLASQREIPLSELFERFILPLPACSEQEAGELLHRVWDQLDARERFVYHKLLSVNFRVGVQRRLVARALAAVAGIDDAIMEHRLLGAYTPTAESYRAIISAAGPSENAARPYPFCLASTLESVPDVDLDAERWQVEWKWDGIRAQLIRRGGSVIAWSRGEEVITDQFPELRAIARALPHDAVIDGEVLAWEENGTRCGPLPFSALQARLNRTRVGTGKRATRLAEVGSLFPSTDLVFMAYDLLESAGTDIRAFPLHIRRAMLEELVAKSCAASASLPLRLSTTIRAKHWRDVSEVRNRATSAGAEGVMIKPLDSPYYVGRTRGDLLGEGAKAGWWKWKIDPLSLDGVLIAAQLGSGKRASLYTDYTFGLWHENTLLPFAKAYSGLSDDEIARADAFVRANTIKRLGPVCIVKPMLVFEIAFEAIQESRRHKSGIAVRFPRIARWRDDKPPGDADTLEAARALLRIRYGSMAPATGGAKRVRAAAPPRQPPPTGDREADSQGSLFPGEPTERGTQ